MSRTDRPRTTRPGHRRPTRPTLPSRRPAGSSLVRSSRVMAAGTMASRALGFARSAVLVAALGSALTFDTFTVANTVPNIIYILLAGGVLNAVFVPQLVRAMKDGPERSRAYTDRLLTLAGLVLLGVTVVATARGAAADRAVHALATDAGATSHVATLFAFWCLPQIFFYGALHDARPGAQRPRQLRADDVRARRQQPGHDRDRAGLHRPVHGRRGRPASLSTRRDRPARAGHHARRRRPGAGPGAGPAPHRLRLPAAVRLPRRRAGPARRLAKWTLLFVLVNQLAYIVIVNLGVRAGRRGHQDVAAVRRRATPPTPTAYLIFILPHSIITVSVVTGLLPRLSREAADGDLAAVRASLSEAWRLTGVGVVLRRRGLVALGPDLTGVLYSGTSARGRALHRPGRRGVRARPAGVLGAVRRAARLLRLRGHPDAVPAAGRDRGHQRACWPWPPTPCCRCAGGWSGSRSPTPLTYVAGLALSTAVLRRRTGGLDGHRVVRHYVRLFIAAVPAGLLGWAVAWAVGQALGDGLVGSLVVAGGRRAVLLAVYVGVARALHVAELTALLARVRPGRRPDRPQRSRPPARRPTKEHALCPAPSARREPGDDRGGIVLGWLTKLTVALGLVGIVLFDAISIGSTMATVSDAGTTPRTRRRRPGTDEGPPADLPRRGRRGRRAEPRERRVDQGLHVDPDGTVHLVDHPGRPDPDPVPLGPHRRVGTREPGRRRAAASADPPTRTDRRDSG